MQDSSNIVLQTCITKFLLQQLFSLCLHCFIYLSDLLSIVAAIQYSLNTHFSKHDLQKNNKSCTMSPILWIWLIPNYSVIWKYWILAHLLSLLSIKMKILNSFHWLIRCDLLCILSNSFNITVTNTMCLQNHVVLS